jgi:hypothetical protein
MSAPAQSNSVINGAAGLHGKKFDVILIESDGAGKEKSHFLTGTGRWHGGRFSIYRGAKLPEVPIPEETLASLIPVPRSLRSLLEGADYMIKLRVSAPGHNDPAGPNSRGCAGAPSFALP